MFRPRPPITTTTTTTTNTTKAVAEHKKALCTGINNYPGNGNDLRGCVNDAKDWKKLLNETYGFNVQMLLDAQLTHGAFTEIAGNLVSDSKAGDSIVLTYSGHGSNVSDKNGDETDGRDECLCLYDKFLIDDTIREITKGLHDDAFLTFISDSCISGDTVIPLLDGTNPTIEELSHRTEPFWVYSSTSKGEIVAGKGHSARKMKTEKVIELVLDSGEILECTDDHLIMMRNGTYKRAGELQDGESLMPFNRKIDDGKKSKYLKDYEIIKNPVDNKWKPTHLMVRDSECLKKENNETICHHKNFNKRDNTPENLKMCTWEAHKKMHGEVGRKNLKKLWENDDFRKWRGSDEYKKGQSNRIKEKWANKEHHSSHSKANEERFERDGFSQKFIDYNFSIDNVKNTTQRQKEGGDLYNLRQDKIFINKFKDSAQTPEAKLKRSESRKEIFRDVNSKLYKSARSPERIRLLKSMSKYKMYLKANELTKQAFTFSQWKDDKSLAVNHKVLEIRKTNKVIDVYDLTVDQYHNFALDVGIFVHNCHSGTVTRAFINSIDGEEPRPRFMPPTDFEGRQGTVSKKVFKPKRGMKEVLIAGCLPTEYSYDARIGGSFNGAMSYYAKKILRQQPVITYDDFYAKLMAILPSSSYPQTPQLEGTIKNRKKIMFL